MQLLKSIKETSERKITKNTILFFFRVVLGLTLFIKGINFVRNQEFLEGLISNIALLEKLSFLKIVIPFIHMLGGFFIIIGVYTRLMILIQLPIIAAAIVFLLISGGASYYREIIFALAIFILLISYLKFGDGLYSWKNLIKNEKNIL
jgi:putative oxidoreductase